MDAQGQLIQASIPDFMGFTVKANSEGQPGPQDFGYDHGDGANGIAAAVEALGMKVYWRTFVYNANVDNDRLKRAYLIVKNYVFNMVADTTLRSLRVNSKHLPSFKPDVLTYNALPPKGAPADPKVEADASDPAATVVVEQATSATGQTRVTVTNGAASSIYTVNLDDTITGSDEFTSAGLGAQWQFLRPDNPAGALRAVHGHHVTER